MVYGSCINRHKQGINLDNPHECSMVLKGEGEENPNTLVGPSVRKQRGVSSFARDHQVQCKVTSLGENRGPDGMYG